MKYVLGALMLSISLAGQSFGGGLLDKMLGGGCGSTCEPSCCCEEPSCCCEEPSCCCEEPSCCVEDPCCGACCTKKPCLLDRLFGNRRGACCGSACCEEPSCCCEEPSCCCEEPSCCVEDPCCGVADCGACCTGMRRGGLLDKLFGNRRGACCGSACCEEPSCCCEEPSCCVEDPCCGVADCGACCTGMRRGGLLAKLFGKRRSACCGSACCGEPSCCCEEPSCCVSNGCCGAAAPAPAPAEVDEEAAPMPAAPTPMDDPNAAVGRQRAVVLSSFSR